MRSSSLSSKFKFLSPNRILFGKKHTFDLSKHAVKDPMKGRSWGLLGTPNVTSIIESCAELEWQTGLLVDHPSLLKKRRMYAFIVLFASIALIFLPLTFLLLIFSIAYLGIFYGAIKNIKTDLIKYAVSKKRGWLYNPKPEADQGRSLAMKHPKLFKLGDKRFIDDQVWGEHTLKGVTREFHSGVYTHIVESRDSKGNKHSTSYPSYFFAIHLEKKIKKEFSLYQESFLTRVGQKFHSKEIDVESIKFNKTFAFDYKGKKDENIISILKIISPAVQIEFLDLNEKGKGLEVLFSDDRLIFVFKGKMLKNSKTKLIGGLKLADEDMALFDDYVQSFNQIAGEIVSKI